MKNVLPALGALVLFSVVPAMALEVRSYTSSELGFKASSHLILGSEEAILVDVQFSRSATYEVVRMVRESGRRLTMVFVTSPRPEHYLGLELLAAELPEARIVARAATAAAIAKEGQETIDHWQPIYLDDIAESVVVPEVLEEIILHLDEVLIEIHEVGEEKDGLPAALYIPEEKTLFASDLVFGNVHPYMKTSPELALAGLRKLRQRLGEVGWVYPGHGAGGGRTLMDDNEKYLETLVKVIRSRAARDAVVRQMQEAFPDYDMPILLERGLRDASI
jgi:glyoxylase-like metal-dependent hydrolase (beta-lactamase superfamily II)